MTTPAPRQQDLPELAILGFIAGIGILVGIILVVVGIFNGNGGYFDGPTLGDIAMKVTCISVGSTLATIGFFALLAALVLSGVRKISENARIHA